MLFEDNIIIFCDIFKSRQFSATNAVTLLIYGMLGGLFFLLPIELQQVAHYSPTEAGASVLPVTALMFALFPSSGTTIALMAGAGFAGAAAVVSCLRLLNVSDTPQG